MSDIPTWQHQVSQWLDHGPALLQLDAVANPGDLAQCLTVAGLETGTVDLAAAADKDEMMRAFQRDLDWPAWFGANWDALADMLLGPEEAEAQPMALIIAGWPEFAERSPDAAATLIELIDELSAEPRSLLVGAVLLPRSES